MNTKHTKCPHCGSEAGFVVGGIVRETRTISDVYFGYQYGITHYEERGCVEIEDMFKTENLQRRDMKFKACICCDCRMTICYVGEMFGVTS